MTTPVFIHDCELCTFLGTIAAKDVAEGTTMDCYFDDDMVNGDPTLILRYGSGPCQNYSFPLSIARHVAAANDKWRRAVNLYENRNRKLT